MIVNNKFVDINSNNRNRFVFCLIKADHYRSNYKGTPKSGFREWGVVDQNRNKKQAYFQLKQVIEMWK
ncbi:hypothetical protein L0668_19260 [Paraglaciecola aquimarina]|uniref:Uncharacterized protein n=1 Tax=Paraglaciecola algarum TaxID=3050085 RepID=A0ABS9DBC2_9ALTE|nr:hypothetical protein [Paraglaciecola sp. G1-23]MCF2950255.1 hypothetical protein [Paraglaciecola sp. G1-23]